MALNKEDKADVSKAFGKKAKKLQAKGKQWQDHGN